MLTIRGLLDVDVIAWWSEMSGSQFQLPCFCECGDRWSPRLQTVECKPLLDNIYWVSQVSLYISTFINLEIYIFEGLRRGSFWRGSLKFVYLKSTILPFLYFWAVKISIDLLWNCVVFSCFILKLTSVAISMHGLLRCHTSPYSLLVGSNRFDLRPLTLIASALSSLISPRSILDLMFSITTGRERPFTKTLRNISKSQSLTKHGSHTHISTPEKLSHIHHWAPSTSSPRPLLQYLIELVQPEIEHYPPSSHQV